MESFCSLSELAMSQDESPYLSKPDSRFESRWSGRVNAIPGVNWPCVVRSAKSSANTLWQCEPNRVSQFLVVESLDSSIGKVKMGFALVGCWCWFHAEPSTGNHIFDTMPRKP
jgi:hypothetical protein